MNSQAFDMQDDRQQSFQQEPAMALAGPIFVIVGAGPVGMRLAHELLRHNALAHVHLLGQESVLPYDRIKLTSLLAGDIKRSTMDLDFPDSQRHPNFRFIAARVSAIHRDEKRVVDAMGNSYAYDQLILATGSQAHVPDVPGKDCEGVYQLRSMRDTEELVARLTRSRHIVVVGGGLLGIEAANPDFS